MGNTSSEEQKEGLVWSEDKKTLEIHHTTKESRLVIKKEELANLDSLAMHLKDSMGIGPPGGFFENLSNLKKLSIHNCNNFSVLTESLLLPNLTHLTANTYRAERGEMGRHLELNFHENLRELVVTHYGLMSITGLKNLPVLRLLDVSISSLSSFEEFKGLSNLEVLNISNTLIGNLNGIETLTSLKELYLDNCTKLLEIPPAIGNLDNLEYLSIQDTYLVTLPSQMERLERFKKIRLSSNVKHECPGYKFINLSQEGIDYNSLELFYSGNSLLESRIEQELYPPWELGFLKNLECVEVQLMYSIWNFNKINGTWKIQMKGNKDAEISEEFTGYKFVHKHQEFGETIFEVIAGLNGTVLFLPSSLWFKYNIGNYNPDISIANLYRRNLYIIIVDTNGKIWICKHVSTSFILLKYFVKNEFKQIASIPDECTISIISEDFINDSIIYLSDHEGYTWKYHFYTDSIEKLDFPPVNRIIFTYDSQFTIDSEGLLWKYSGGGKVCFSKNQNLPLAKFLFENPVTHSFYFIDENGDTWGLGENIRGVLGVGDNFVNSSIWSQVPLNDIVFITNTVDNTIFLTKTGDIYTCGHTNHGFCKLINKTVIANTPTKIASINLFGMFCTKKSARN